MPTYPTRKMATMMAFTIIALLSCRTQNLFQTAHGEKTTASDSLFFRVEPGYAYTIRPNDKISISIWDHDDLSVGSLYGIYNSNEVYGKWLLVNIRGEINMPRIGALRIGGLTVLEAEDTLRRRLSYWINHPIVNVKVLNKEVSVMGEIKNPGRFLLEKDNNTLVELLSRAGDFDFYANKKSIRVIRMDHDLSRQITIDLTRMDNFQARNIHILPGDVIYVPAKKGKDFDKRISTIIPFASIVTAFAIGYGTFF